eukprot:CAMPEP_0119005810 /NCGR_PEP_ID=MMETSP1176-20130426/1942_1 /TAXON_ID=265551 /ORGANISM="Synedropsis recta cf, Strain CCMP1620" /LENGTH=206 /DNA_ID=CAMNT_0006957655 /DNA_START=68 /DNA_END=688 /DNA_ORIENTATION=-
MIMKPNQSVPDVASLLRMDSTSSTASTLLQHQKNDSIPTKVSSSWEKFDNKKGVSQEVTSSTLSSFGSQAEASTTTFASKSDISSNDRSEAGNGNDGQDITMTSDELLAERRAKNRLSAHQSRLRKRSELKYLQHEVLNITDRNKKLKRTNEAAVQELAAVRIENAQLRLMAHQQQQDAMRYAVAFQAAQEGGINGSALNPFLRRF